MLVSTWMGYDGRSNKGNNHKSRKWHEDPCNTLRKLYLREVTRANLIVGPKLKKDRGKSQDLTTTCIYSTLWILDSRENRHVIGNVNLLLDYCLKKKY